MTHSDLVALAAKWLHKKHAVVITEMVTTGECPDAIGWRGTYSTLVECKVSREDFKADAKKNFRRTTWMGIGQQRYFMAPAGLILANELPAQWGLLEVTGSRVKLVKKSTHFNDVNSRHEIGILLSAIRRIGEQAPKCVSVKFYTFQTGNTATMGLNCEQLSPVAEQVGH